MEVMPVVLLLAALTTTFLGSTEGFLQLPRDFPCTKEEHECLSLGRLLNPEDGNCYRVLAPGVWEKPSCSDSNFYFRANKPRLLAGGPLFGECTVNSCNFDEVLTASGRCENFQRFVNQTCKGVKQDLRPTNVFGEAVCGPYNDFVHPLPAAPPYGEYTGRCTLPFLMSPTKSPEYINILYGSNLPCTAQELDCYQKGQVLFNGACWPLREKGPCAEGEWLVLDDREIKFTKYGFAQENSSRVAPICKRRPCPEGQYLPVEGTAAGKRCVRPADIRRRFCGSYLIVVDALGRISCGPTRATDSFRWTELPSTKTDPGRCTAGSFGTYAAVQGVAGRECIRDDDGRCKADVRAVDTPFFLSPEDY